MSINILNNASKIKGIKLSLATPNDVLNWSSGEVTKAETINYKTFKHEKGGLFDELIFGPSVDFKCPICEKKYKKISEGQICENTDKCKKLQPEILSRVSRRRRMGHIDLATPIVHFWFFKVNHSIIAKLLGLKSPESKRIYSRLDLEDIIYFRSHIVLESGGLKALPKNQIININSAPIIYRNAFREILTNTDDPIAVEEIKEATRELESLASSRLGRDYGVDFYELNTIIETYSSAKIGVGGAAIEYLLKELDIPKEIKDIQKQINEISILYRKSNLVSQSKIFERNKLYKRLKILKGFEKTNQDTTCLLIKKLPIIPADLRPLIQLDGGRHTTTDLNELYRRIIIRNNRLKKWLELQAPVLIVQNEMRMLQEAVDALIDNKRKKPSPVLSKDNRPLKSIADALTGKKGRFRQNLLGKRVDYSGRSVIVVGPKLKMHQVGLPRDMVAKLFEPFIIRELIENEIASSIKNAKKYIDELNPIIWKHAQKVIKNKVVLLNRAPTLHRLSIQAFEPVLVRGKAILLHPLVTTAFNADFDGDQMAVHVPISDMAANEARELMMANRNILGPKDGEPIINPGQDMVLGMYYLSKEKPNAKGEGRYFANFTAMLRAYKTGVIDLHARVAISTNGFQNKILGKVKENGYIVSTTGKFIFNNAFPNRFNFVFGPKYINHKNVPNAFFVPRGGDIKQFIKNMELNDPFTKQDVASIIRNIYDQYAPMITKRDLSQIVKITNSEVLNDTLIFIRKTCEKNNIQISSVHALILKDLLEKRFNQINKRIKLRNNNVERFLEVEERVELLEKIWFDYNNIIAQVLDNVKEIGFDFSTMSGISMSIFDIIPSKEKEQKVIAGEEYVNQLKVMYENGWITDEERYNLVIQNWSKIKDEVETEIKGVIQNNPDNPLFTMLNSGARSNLSNIVQLAGLRGLMADASVILKANDKNNKLTKVIIEIPVKSSFLDGLTGFEFYSSTHGARKALTDVALNTANAGYLTRKLVNACQDIIVKEKDCQSDVAFKVKNIMDSKTNTIISPLEDRIIGRFPIEDVVDNNGNVIVDTNTLITVEHAKLIKKAQIPFVNIRSVLGCHVSKGVCAKCYGIDLVNNKLVNIGEPVGIVASQSIGEPGTQLTMRTFHTGGVAQAGGGITGGFQRLKELIDATQTPWSEPAIISEINGKVIDISQKIHTFTNAYSTQSDKITTVTVERTQDDKVIDTRKYHFPSGRRLRVKLGQDVIIGQKIIEGPIVLRELSKIADAYTVQNYILKEIQRLYRMQGIVIADKYVEIVIRQMFSKLIISDPGETELFAGSIIDINEYVRINKEALDTRRAPAYGSVVITGVRKVASLSDSFLDAASYQETPTILVNSSINADLDYLEGPKENIILGKKIPAGTGFEYESNNKYDVVNSFEYFE